MIMVQFDNSTNIRSSPETEPVLSVRSGSTLKLNRTDCCQPWEDFTEWGAISCLLVEIMKDLGACLQL